MKKLKKSSTFGQYGKWQIDFDQLTEIENKIDSYEISIYPEDIEDVCLALIDLGYLTFKED